jgi:hypothetical protein
MKGKRRDLVMAFYPNALGFAYVIFEGSPYSPVDWGVCEVLWREDRGAFCVRRVSALIDRYRLDTVVLRCAGDGGAAYAVLVEAVEALAASKGVGTVKVTRTDIRQAFAHLRSPTRYAIAETIAQRIPIFAPLFPPVRKIWNGENRRMGLFDAAALAMTYFGEAGVPEPT